MVTRSVMYKLCTLIFITFLAKSSFALDVSAHVDNNIIQMGQLFTLTVQVDGKSSSPQPDFSVLKQDFDIQSQPSRSSQTQIINGSMSSSTSWSLVLAPRRPGAAIIPPINIEGKQTEPITIVVGKATAAQNKEAYYEVEISKTEVYVQEQIVLDVKLYIQMMNLSNLQVQDFDLNDALVVPNGESKRSQVSKNGLRFYLFEQQYFIFPEKSGDLEVPGQVASAIVTEGGSRFNRFGTQRRINASSPSILVKIKSIPSAYPAGAPWLPAKDILINHSTTPSLSAKVGDALTRNITITATGLPATSISPLLFDEQDGLKIYPDQGQTEDLTDGTNIIGKRTDSFALLPSKSGNLTIPAKRFYWWDTINDTLRTSEIPPVALNITADPNIARNGLESLGKQTLEQDTSPIKASALEDTFLNKNNTLLLALTVLFFVLWVGTLLGFLIYIRRKQTLPPADIKQNKNDNKALKLKGALDQLKAASECDNLTRFRLQIINWGCIYYENKHLAGLDEIANKVNDPSLKDLLHQIDTMLYASAHSDKKIDYQSVLSKINDESKKTLSNKQRKKMVFDRPLKALYSE